MNAPWWPGLLDSFAGRVRGIPLEVMTPDGHGHRFTGAGNMLLSVDGDLHLAGQYTNDLRTKWMIMQHGDATTRRHRVLDLEDLG